MEEEIYEPVSPAQGESSRASEVNSQEQELQVQQRSVVIQKPKSSRYGALEVNPSHHPKHVAVQYQQQKNDVVGMHMPGCSKNLSCVTLQSKQPTNAMGGNHPPKSSSNLAYVLQSHQLTNEMHSSQQPRNVASSMYPLQQQAGPSSVVYAPQQSTSVTSSMRTPRYSTAATSVIHAPQQSSSAAPGVNVAHELAIATLEGHQPQPDPTVTYMPVRDYETLQEELKYLRRELRHYQRQRQQQQQQQQQASNNNTSQSEFSSNFYEGIISIFNGENMSVYHWTNQIRGVMNLFYLPENQMKMIFLSKLRGRALDWYHSKSYHGNIKLDKILKLIEIAFDSSPSRALLKRKFELRIWNGDESFLDYFQDKHSLARMMGLSDEDTIDFILEGIPDFTKMNRVYFDMFKDISFLLRAFIRIHNSRKIPK